MTEGGRSHAGRDRQRGFTLIELMIALLVSSLLVGMILAIFSRMSLAYRGQQQIAGVQQVLAAARTMIELDAKQAGLGMAQGFKVAVPGVTNPLAPVQVTDSATGPDQIAFFYADPSTQAVVQASAAWPATITVDSAVGFTGDTLVVLSTVVGTTPNPLGGADIASYDACVLQIVPGGPSGKNISFVASPPWGTGDQAHCTAPVVGQTMMYPLVARAYRIDLARAALGPLQQSLTGGLLGDTEVWNDLAYGFTDIQSAERIVLPPSPALPGTDPDADGDAYRDWYSDATQSAMNTVPPGAPLATATLMQMSISLVARTDRDVEGIATRATPNLIDPAHPGNNPIGNRASIALPSKPPWLADPALQGQRIYRYITFQVDFRNLGVGL